MRRALALARSAGGDAAPNPLVGAVLVHDGRLLAEGWHQRAGGPHAEVVCLEAFGEGAVPADAVLYVSLEPCVHQGRTPPCTDLLMRRGVKHVVVAHADPDPRVAGKGVERLRQAGINVQVGIGEAEARWTNRRFLSSVERARPYVVLKWARTSDGLLDRQPRSGRGTQRISSPGTDVLVHRWRTQEQAILVGSRTVIHDDPSLTVRHVAGRSPLRVVIDRQGLVPSSSRVFDGSAPTLLLTERPRTDLPARTVVIAPGTDPMDTLLMALHGRGIRSILVEGGATLHRQFLERELWDEVRTITAPVSFGSGTPAPRAPGVPIRVERVGPDLVHYHARTASPHASWPW